jgi:hypothetical protein
MRAYDVVAVKNLIRKGSKPGADAQPPHVRHVHSTELSLRPPGSYPVSDDPRTLFGLVPQAGSPLAATLGRSWDDLTHPEKVLFQNAYEPMFHYAQHRVFDSTKTGMADAFIGKRQGLSTDDPRAELHATVLDEKHPSLTFGLLPKRLQEMRFVKSRGSVERIFLHVQRLVTYAARPEVRARAEGLAERLTPEDLFAAVR